MKLWPRSETELPRAVDLDDPKVWPPIVPAVRPPSEFAPRRQRMADIDHAVRQITTFGALPTKEIDDLIAVANEELAALEADAQRIRNAYVEVTDKLRAQIERQRKVQRFASEAMANMAQQCAALDQPELPFDPQPAVQEDEVAS